MEPWRLTEEELASLTPENREKYESAARNYGDTRLGSPLIYRLDGEWELFKMGWDRIGSQFLKPADLTHLQPPKQ